LERKVSTKKKILPVFRLYASLPRTSLLQGTASTGANRPKQLFILRVAGTETTVNKPDCNESPQRSEDL
jgi:hypothetical protein